MLQKHMRSGARAGYTLMATRLACHVRLQLYSTQPAVFGRRLRMRLSASM